MMETKLRLNDGKGGRGDWQAMNPIDLIDLLETEVGEAWEVINRGQIGGRHTPADPDRYRALCVELANECADIANFAMMVADAVGVVEGFVEEGDLS
jgi:NTP pyrophosphatase (non-canonical NTP hydrolase)